MKNNNYSDFFSKPSNRRDAETKAEKLIGGLKKDEKEELDSILSDKNKINAILSSPAAKKILEKMNDNGHGHQ